MTENLEYFHHFQATLPSPSVISQGTASTHRPAAARSPAGFPACTTGQPRGNVSSSLSLQWLLPHPMQILFNNGLTNIRLAKWIKGMLNVCYLLPFYYTELQTAALSTFSVGFIQGLPLEPKA